MMIIRDQIKTALVCAGSSFWKHNHLIFVYAGGKTVTHAQKGRITSLRGEGASYAQIAATLGLSENTVKSYGRRSRLDSVATKNVPITDTTGSCDHCGRAFVVSSQKAKRFCTNKCRMVWWRAHPEQMNRKAIQHIVCFCCGVAFDHYGNSRRKYCSHACYVRARTSATRSVEVRA